MVPSNVNFEAVDIAIDSLAICQNGTALFETIFKVAAFSREKASGGVVRMGLRTQFEPPQFGATTIRATTYRIYQKIARLWHSLISYYVGSVKH